MIRLVSLFGSQLNLNGDLANIKVIERQLGWRGLDVQVIDCSTAEQLREARPDFVLVGHGSVAAWKSIETEFVKACSVLDELILAGVAALAVSSGFEALHPHLAVLRGQSFESKSRVSKFDVSDFEGHRALGYRNTEAQLSSLSRHGSLVGTMLHGPVLVKNPELLESTLRAICAHAEVDLPEVQSKEKADQLADLVSRVWKLEEALASE
jgi:lipid II isoglutaminyl synthase (glutamine-hydrolysing)